MAQALKRRLLHLWKRLTTQPKIVARQTSPSTVAVFVESYCGSECVFTHEDPRMACAQAEGYIHARAIARITRRKLVVEWLA